MNKMDKDWMKNGSVGKETTGHEPRHVQERYIEGRHAEGDMKK
jgi:hypothetical protein